MKKDPLYKLLKKSESIGLLCNHSAWHATTGQYSFQSLAATGKLKKVFIPEHGLFGELQDQVKLDDTSIYSSLAPGFDWISLYNSLDGSMTATDETLKGIDTLLIDLQDVGSRYYTFTSTTWLLLNKITSLKLDIKVVVLDKPNPAGRQVEGTRMTKDYASFIGLEGMPHRHGLTMAELCRYFKNKMNGDWELFVYPINPKDHRFIAPSPNIPSVAVCNLYSGQCLWEGTTISEGRGTTHPFEMIGAPSMDWVFQEDWNNQSHPAFQKNCQVRPTRFVPVFHKFANETCNGIQLLPAENKPYHSLAHSLKLVRYVKERNASFEWRAGVYEAFNDKKAIELLVGDALLLGWFEGKIPWKEIKEKINEEERAWIKEASPFLIYKPSLQKLKLN